MLPHIPSWHAWGWLYLYLSGPSNNMLFVIAGFCHDVDQISVLLGYYPVSNGNPFFCLFFLDYVTLEDGTNTLFQMLVKDYHSMLHNTPEKRNLNILF
jgi:hypothetical protein